MSEEPNSVDETKKRGTFFVVRVGILLCVLAIVLVYAWHDVTSRRARNDWDHTLEIAVVLVRRDAVDDAAIEALHRRLGALEDRLTEEIHRYKPDAPRPFAFRFFGPVDSNEPAPTPDGEGAIDLLHHAWNLSRYLGRIDDAASVNARAFDARIYVSAKKPVRADRTMVEGVSEENGRIGQVDVELDADMADYALVVVAHELFHTLGASDKYDAQGRTVIPDGLAEPDREPRFPQRFVEIMARTRPLGPSEERIPDGIDDVAVGPITAREIGWSK